MNIPEGIPHILGFLGATADAETTDTGEETAAAPLTHAADAVGGRSARVAVLAVVALRSRRRG